MLATGLLSVRQSRGKGFGVFATDNIDKGILIEESPVIFVPGSKADLVMGTPLGNYVFDFPFKKDRSRILLALGYGSLFNHSDKPNAEAYLPSSHRERVLSFWTIKPIKAGEEVTISYNDPDSLWFNPKK